MGGEENQIAALSGEKTMALWCRSADLTCSAWVVKGIQMAETFLSISRLSTLQLADVDIGTHAR
jgi:hypothetical protein